MSDDLTIEDLKSDEENPRFIEDENRKQLEKSIKTFNNISEIVFNKRTNQLVCGHQRLKSLKSIYKDLKLQKSEKENYYDLTSDGEFIGFCVKIVDWDIEKQKAANLVANSQFVQGEFDDLKLDTVLNNYDFSEFGNFKFDELLMSATGNQDNFESNQESKNNNNQNEKKDLLEIPCLDENKQELLSLIKQTKEKINKSDHFECRSLIFALKFFLDEFNKNQ